VKILNVGNLKPAPMEELTAFCRRRVDEGRGAFLIAMNPIKVVKARRHPDFQSIIDGADWVFPDAWGMGWAARLLHGRAIPLLPGWQVMLALLADAAREGRRVFVLGTTDDALAAASRKIRENHPGLLLAGTHNGYYTDGEEAGVFAAVAESRPDYLFVAMGEYLQERVIVKLRERIPAAVCLGVGGSVDLLAGRQPLPPRWVRERHLEWLYRFFRQPWRIPRLRALPVFAALVLRERMAR